ncbi:hypothetical protein PIB30_002552 [Stylosanthes scabra]|uniref:Uncharacterized protein n=1 Tax=Stylosanthes scabra TaxID=79078 RepID=A0ABU6Y3D6_9FABA|nr:hypothetical protein [Stylosanthes scabra]
MGVPVIELQWKPSLSRMATRRELPGKSFPRNQKEMESPLQRCSNHLRILPGITNLHFSFCDTHDLSHFSVNLKSKETLAELQFITGTGTDTDTDTGATTPKQIHEIKDFLLTARRNDARSVKIKRSRHALCLRL